MTKRYGMVIDLTTCFGCQACTAACTTQNETPYWDGQFRTKVEDVERGSFPAVSRTFFPHMCMHCDEPACVTVCPTGASYKREDGIVMIDYEKCLGCKACMEACPYNARYFYDEKAVKTAGQIYGSSNQHQVPHVDKCLFCYDRLAEGMQPACVATCPGGARIFGDWEEPNSPVNQAFKAAGNKAHRVKGTAIAYISATAGQSGVLPPDQASPTWVKAWKGAAEPAARAVLGTAVGVLAVATVANLSQKKKEEEHE